MGVGGMVSCWRGGDRIMWEGGRGCDHAGGEKGMRSCGRGKEMGLCGRREGDGLMWEAGKGWVHVGGGKGMRSCGRGKEYWGTL